MGKKNELRYKLSLQKSAWEAGGQGNPNPEHEIYRAELQGQVDINKLTLSKHSVTIHTNIQGDSYFYLFLQKTRDHSLNGT